jgi:CheY-like chemotaxis protein
MFTGEQQGMQGLRVLVVDDYQDAADSLALLLRFYACEVQVALNGPSALAILQTWWPDAAILDIGLPGMDGYQVAKFIRAHSVERSKPLLIALTGFGRDEDRRRCAAEGMDHHYVKPADPARLLDLLRDRKSLVISH